MSQSPLITVSNGLLTPEHFAEIGPALWVLLVFIDWQTSPDGKVLGGKPIKVSEIAERLGCSTKSVPALPSAPSAVSRSAAHPVRPRG